MCQGLIDSRGGGGGELCNTGEMCVLFGSAGAQIIFGGGVPGNWFLKRREAQSNATACEILIYPLTISSEKKMTSMTQAVFFSARYLCMQVLLRRKNWHNFRLAINCAS